MKSTANTLICQAVLLWTVSTGYWFIILMQVSENQADGFRDFSNFFCHPCEAPISCPCFPSPYSPLSCVSTQTLGCLFSLSHSYECSEIAAQTMEESHSHFFSAQTIWGIFEQSSCSCQESRWGSWHCYWWSGGDGQSRAAQNRWEHPAITKEK